MNKFVSFFKEYDIEKNPKKSKKIAGILYLFNYHY